MAKVLLVDDDKELLYIEGRYLEQKNYKVITAESGQDALLKLSKTDVDCIVLDVMMPGMDGFSAYRKIRDCSSAPILFLSGRSEKEDRIKGLMIGADDYIVKPVSMEELALRIAIAVRRNEGTKNADNVLSFKLLSIDLLTQSVYWEGEKLNLANREYELLVYFAKHPGEVLSFEQIGMALFGTYLESDRKTIMVITSRLRKKMSDYKGCAELLETVWGKGYKFIG